MRDGCDAVAIVCTNMRGAGVAEPLERELGIPVLPIRLQRRYGRAWLVPGVSPARIKGWGSLFQDERPATVGPIPGDR